MPKNQTPPTPDPIDIEGILGLLGRAVNSASAGANAVVRRAQGTPISGGKAPEKSGNAINDALTTILDTVINSGDDFVHSAVNADRARGRSYSGKRNGRNADQLGVYPSGGNWKNPEEEAGFSGIMNDVMRRMRSGMNTIDMEVMRPIKRTIAENNQRKEDRKKEKADLAIRTQQKSVERLPNGLKMTIFEQRKSPAYPSGGNWFDPESESGLEGIITNAKRSMNSRNGNTKKRGSVRKGDYATGLFNNGNGSGINYNGQRNPSKLYYDAQQMPLNNLSQPMPKNFLNSLSQLMPQTGSGILSQLMPQNGSNILANEQLTNPKTIEQAGTLDELIRRIINGQPTNPNTIQQEEQPVPKRIYPPGTPDWNKKYYDDMNQAAREEEANNTYKEIYRKQTAQAAEEKNAQDRNENAAHWRWMNKPVKKRGSVEKASLGGMAERAARAASRMGEYGGIADKIGLGLGGLQNASKFDWLERMGLKGNPEFAQYELSSPIPKSLAPKFPNSSRGSLGYLNGMPFADTSLAARMKGANSELIGLKKPKSFANPMRNTKNRGIRPFDVEAEASPFTRFDENPAMRPPIVPELRGRTDFDIESEIAPRNMGFSDPDVYNGFTPDEYKQMMDRISPGASRLFENASPAYLAEIIRSMPDYPTFFPQSSSFTQNPASMDSIKGFTLKRAVTKRAKKEPSGMGKSMLKSDMCKCGSGMMKSMCKCGGGMGKSMYKSMSGKMDADMAITPQKVSTSRSIKSSNKYFN